MNTKDILEAEQYIERATRVAVGELPEPGEDDHLSSIRFWQRQTSTDRFHATCEIVKRVHSLKGGDPEVFWMDRSVARLIRRQA